MNKIILTSLASLSLAAAGTGVALSGCGGDSGLSGCTTTLKPSADDDTALQTAFIEAQSGDTICLDKGTYHLTETLSVAGINGLTIKGTGPETILDFSGLIGAKAFDVTIDNFTAQDFAILDTPSDGIDVTGATNVTFRGLKVYWTAGSVTENGAYAIFPVACTNVIVEDCEVIGASDAGIYVGQSNHILVRRNKVHGNVAGIEIENSQDAEVYENESYDNTAGILVFNLPNLPVKDGRRTIVRDNDIHDNNRTNFAPGGSIVASVPTGIGIVVMAADEIEIHSNSITGNVSTGVAVASYLALPLPPPDQDPMYDAYPETIFVHDNTFATNGTDPQDLLLLPMQATLEDIIWDGYFDMAKDNSDKHLSLCIMNNGAATYRNIDGDDFMQQSTDITPHLCTHPSVPSVTF